MFNFLKNLFKKVLPVSYSTGAFESPIDTRNISIAQVQTPVSIPSEYKTDISMLPIENQLGLGTCVAQSHTKMVQFFIYKVTGKIIDLSVRAPYKWAKEIDGIPTMQGTYPSVMAKILTKKGIPLATYALNLNYLSHEEYLNIKVGPDGLKDASSRVLAGYAFVPLDLGSIQQAIYQNGVITGTLDVEADWFSGIIKKVLRIIGRHSTLWIGYDSDGIYARNSWGNWIGQTLGKLLFGTGEFYFKWEDYKNNVYDVIAYLKIPEALLQEVEGKTFQFLNDLKFGSEGYEVYKLQERLKIVLVDGKFGKGTQNMVKDYQSKNGLVPDGSVGKKTREKLNMKKSYLDEWCAAIKQMEGAKPERNNPGNLRYVGQKYAVNDRGFCKFDTYQHGYDALKNLLIRACTGTSSMYKPEMTLTDFYRVYAPSSDGNNPEHYAQFVADKLGLPVDTKIKNLI